MSSSLNATNGTYAKYYPSVAFSCHSHICTTLTRNWSHAGWGWLRAQIYESLWFAMLSLRTTALMITTRDSFRPWKPTNHSFGRVTATLRLRAYNHTYGHRNTKGGPKVAFSISATRAANPKLFLCEEVLDLLVIQDVL